MWTIWCFFGYCFPAVDGEKTALMAALAYRLSQAVMPTALGLGVAILATWGLQHFRAQLSEFDLEMRVAAETLPGILAAWL